MEMAQYVFLFQYSILNPTEIQESWWFQEVFITIVEWIIPLLAFSEAFLMYWLKYDFGNRKTGSAIFAASDLDLYHRNDIILMVTLITWLRQYRSCLATVTLLFLPLLYTIFFGRKALDNSQLEVTASFSLLPPGCSIYINYLEFP